MTADQVAVLVPAIVAFLAAATGLLRLALKRRQSSSAEELPPDVPCSHDQSCPPGGK